MGLIFLLGKCSFLFGWRRHRSALLLGDSADVSTVRCASIMLGANQQQCSALMIPVASKNTPGIEMSWLGRGRSEACVFSASWPCFHLTSWAWWWWLAVVQQKISRRRAPSHGALILPIVSQSVKLSKPQKHLFALCSSSLLLSFGQPGVVNSRYARDSRAPSELSSSRLLAPRRWGRSSTRPCRRRCHHRRRPPSVELSPPSRPAPSGTPPCRRVACPASTRSPYSFLLRRAS
jgi:hypothetical protein